MPVLAKLNGNNGINELTRGAVIIAFFSVISRLVGVWRDRLLASTFGADKVLDSYYAAFKLPDFIFNTFVLGALAAALIPIFIQYREESGLTKSFELVNKILNWLLLVLISCTAIGLFFAPWLVRLIAPGFDAPQLDQTISLTRVMLFAVVIFGVSNVLGSVLQAQQKLTAYAIAPVFYNIGIITGIFWLTPILGPIGLAWGVVTGSLLHLLVQLPSAWAVGWRWKINFDIRDYGLKQFIRLLVPRTLGLAASQINQLVTISFVSNLPVGSLAAYSLALNLHSFPINVFGVSLAVAVFPLLSQALSTSKQNDFTMHFSQSIRRILFYVLPLSVMFLVLRAQLVRIVLGSGEFDWTDTIRTAQILGFLALAIVSDSVLPVVARSFYALKDTKTPLFAALASIVVNFLLLVLLGKLGLPGVGIAYVCSSIINLLVLLFVLSRRINNLGADYIISGVWRMCLGALIAASSAWGTLQLLAPRVNMNTFWGIFIQGSLAGLAGIISYLIISIALKLKEINFVNKWFHDFLKVLKIYT